MMKKMGRGVGHMFDQLLMRGIITVLVVGGLLIVGTTLADTYEDTSFVKVTQCTFFGTTREDCPAYGAALASLEADKAAAEDEAEDTRRRAEEDRQKAARILADAEANAAALQDKLNDIRAVQSDDNTFTLFGHIDDPNSDWKITVATEYKSLVPPDPTPKTGCYVNLPSGSAGENRNWWFKNHNGSIQDDRRLRRQHNISDAAWVWAKTACQPILIGDGNG